MFKNLILYALIAHCGVWAKPVQQQSSDLASHVVIVTPQAQVHLEPATKFGPFIHHLSPFARISAPHEETIVYVPASAAAPIIPIEALAQHVVGRSNSGDSPQPQTKQMQGASQVAQIQQAFEQGQAAASAAQAAAQEGFGQISSQFAEAAASFSPASFFPSPNSQNKDEKLSEKGQTPANTQALLPATGRHFYAVATPIVPHIVDFVHTAPVLVSPVSVLRARSLEDASQVPIIAVPLPEESKPEALPLKTELKKDLKEVAAPAAAAAAGDSAANREKTSDFGRFLEANALKSDVKQEQQQFDEQFKRDNLQSDQKDQLISTSESEKALESQAELEKPQLKSVFGGVDGADVSAVVVPGGVGNSVVDDVVPQSKVA